AQRDAVGDRLARFALADRPRDELLEAFDRRRRRRNELRHFGRAERGEEVLRVAGAQFAKLDDLAGERRQTAAPVDARGRRRNRGGEHRHLVNGEAHDYLPPFTEVPQMMLSRSAVPQMMLSPPSVPQMKLSSEVPQMMLSPAAVPQMMLSVSSVANVICSELFFAISLFSAADVPQMMLSSADDVPQMMLSSPVVPQMMLSSSFAQVPQMMLSPSALSHTMWLPMRSPTTRNCARFADVPQMMLSSSAPNTTFFLSNWKSVPQMMLSADLPFSLIRLDPTSDEPFTVPVPQMMLSSHARLL